MQPLPQLTPASVPVKRERGDGRREDWRILAILGPYRLLLLAVLWLLFHFHLASEVFAAVPARFFALGGLLYTALAIGLQWLVMRRTLVLTAQALLQFGVDLLAVFLLVGATGGVGGGLGVVLIPSLVACCLVLPPRLATVLAAAAALGMLGEEFWRQLHQPVFDSNDLSQVGLLGLMFFATGLTAAMVGARARRSEATAARVGSEYLNLTQINNIIIAEMRSGVLVVDADGVIRSTNVAARRMSGGEIANFRALRDAMPALDAQLTRWREGPAAGRSMLPLQGAGGRELLAHFTRLGFDAEAPTLIMLEDAGELRAQAQQLKLAALGRLSANIAHEIRNPLAAIAQAGQLLDEAIGEGPNRRLLGMIQRHTARIDQIVKSVLEISRRAPGSRQHVFLRELVTRSAALYQETHAQSPRAIATGGVPAHLSVSFDPDQLQQVLFNLWDNSFEQGGGETHVSLAGGVDAESGYVYLDVIDDGPGIAAELQERIFEPFFTTHHAGTGLGLYLCRELCEYNHAQLRYRPIGRGACFRLVFLTPAALSHA